LARIPNRNRDLFIDFDAKAWRNLRIHYLTKAEMKFMSLYRSLIYVSCAAAMIAAANASAQYVWINEKGVKQYSDMPPPASVPASKILKHAGGIPTSAPSGTQPEGAAGDNSDAVPEKSKQPLTTAEKNAEFQKRKMEQAEKEKKAAEQQQQAAEKSKNCERAQAYQRSLESGERLARADKNGERYYLSDQQRSQEAQENKRFLDTCK
jgi:hypothetical protein